MGVLNWYRFLFQSRNLNELMGKLVPTTKCCLWLFVNDDAFVSVFLVVFLIINFSRILYLQNGTNKWL